MSYSKSDSDLEKSISRPEAETVGAGEARDGLTKRNLKSRHVQMIALAGTIGTGLFVGVGSVLHTAGPLGLWLGYTFMGLIVWSMMVALGEMTTFLPVSGAFAHYAARFIDPAWGFALGWNYWYLFGMGQATNSVAAALLIEYWPRGAAVSPAAFITVFLTFIALANFLNVRIYGEAEFLFAMCKLTTLVGLILLGIVITAGGGPDHASIGFRYWHEGAFQQMNGIPGAWGRFLAFWTVFIQAVFSFAGTEIIALAAGETANPRRAVPKAIKSVFYRIIFFYVVGTFVLGLICSPNNPSLTSGSGVKASPWVIAIETAGIKGLPSVVNAAVILSAFSAGESDLFASSRTLYGLAMDGRAPKVFQKCTKSGVPIYATAVTFLFGFLGYLTIGDSASTVFSWLSNLGATTGLIAWASILLAYLRFHFGLRAQGISRDSLPYKAPLQPYLSFFGLAMMILIILFNGYTYFLRGNWNTNSFIVSYISLPIFVAFLAFWKLYKRTSFVRLHEMDFVTGLAEIDAQAREFERREAEEAPNRGWWDKFWDAVF